MSHYSVAVFTDGTTSVEELLAPYDENIQVEPYIGWTRDEMIAHAKEMREKALAKQANGDALSDYERRYLRATTDDEFYELEFDPNNMYDDAGNQLTTYNPDSKWDWYSIGGRWSDYCDRFGIDLDGIRVADFMKHSLTDQDEYQRAVRFWELYVGGEEPKTEEDKSLVKFVFYKKEYYLTRYKDKETYARLMSQFSTYAVVLPDGSWHAPGEMGWFGCSSETDEESIDWEENYIERFIRNADPNWTMTIVDCHI